MKVVTNYEFTLACSSPSHTPNSLPIQITLPSTYQSQNKAQHKAQKETARTKPSTSYSKSFSSTLNEHTMALSILFGGNCFCTVEIVYPHLDYGVSGTVPWDISLKIPSHPAFPIPLHHFSSSLLLTHKNSPGNLYNTPLTPLTP